MCQNPSGGSNRVSFVAVREQILQWIVRDRYKAKLSIIHCGALYWNVRRYSYDSILEPYAIYIATLIFWAYCVTMQLPEVIEAIDQDGEDHPEPSFLHLDKPLDDELVQTFVRIGHKVAAYISKVGNIVGEGVSTKILEEGISLLTGDTRNLASGDYDALSVNGESRALRGAHTWGIEESYLKSLRDLLVTTSETTRISAP